ELRESLSGKAGPPVGSLAQPGQRFRFDPRTEFLEPREQLTFVPWKRCLPATIGSEVCQCGGRPCASLRGLQPRFDECSKMKEYPSPCRLSPMSGGKSRPAGEKPRADPLDMLARVQAVGLEIGAVAGVWTSRAATKMDAVRKARGACDDEEWRALGPDN